MKNEVCGWCDKGYRFEFNWIDIYGNTITTDDNMVIGDVANYCPCCGRKLGVGVMKTYLVTGQFGVDLEFRLEQFGKVEKISIVYNIYSLTTDVCLEEIEALNNVVSVREEENTYLGKFVL